MNPVEWLVLVLYLAFVAFSMPHKTVRDWLSYDQCDERYRVFENTSAPVKYAMSRYEDKGRGR